MKIKIKNIDTLILKKIDLLAKKKGLSRNKFLNIYFENIINQNHLFNVYSDYENLVKKVEEEIKNNTKVLNKTCEVLLRH